MDELRFLKRHTRKPVKITLPGPYLLTRAMYVPSVAQSAYPTKEDLGEDVVALLKEEVGDLVREGADFIQLDEPVLNRGGFHPGPDAELHVRFIGGPQRPCRRAGVRHLAHQPRR